MPNQTDTVHRYCAASRGEPTQVLCKKYAGYWARKWSARAVSLEMLAWDFTFSVVAVVSLQQILTRIKQGSGDLCQEAVQEVASISYTWKKEKKDSLTPF